MQIGDTVKVFSSTSDHDGETGRVVLIASAPGAPAPYGVQFADATTEPFSERELVSLKPIEPLWLLSPLETVSAPHGASSAVQMYIGRIIARKFMESARRRLMVNADTDSIVRKTLEGYSPCLQCGKLFCSHR